MDWELSYSKKARTVKFLRTTWGGSNHGGGSGVKSILHYACIIPSEPKKKVQVPTNLLTDINGTQTEKTSIK